MKQEALTKTVGEMGDFLARDDVEYIIAAACEKDRASYMRIDMNSEKAAKTLLALSGGINEKDEILSQATVSVGGAALLLRQEYEQFVIAAIPKDGGEPHYYGEVNVADYIKLVDFLAQFAEKMVNATLAVQPDKPSWR